MPYLSDGTVAGDTSGGNEKCEITITTNMAATTSVETRDDATTRPRIVKEPVQKSKSEKVPEMKGTIKTNNPSVRKDAGKIPFTQLFLPKLRFIIILFKVDPIAAWIITASILMTGLGRSWSLAFRCQAITVFQEAIISRKLESTTMAPLLLQQVAVEIFLQVSTFAGTYGQKRCKKKMSKHLTKLLIEAYGWLPYPVRMDSYTEKRYLFAGGVGTHSPSLLRGLGAVLTSMIEWVFDLFFIIHLLLFHTGSRKFILATLSFFAALTYLKILNKWEIKKSTQYRRRRFLKKGKAKRRCDEMEGEFHRRKGECREAVLHNVTPWQIQEYIDSMDQRIAKPKASILKRVVKRVDLLENFYWMGEKIGFSAVVVYFGTTISLADYNMLEKRLFSMCSTTSVLANYLGMDGIWDEFLRQYFELLDQGEAERKNILATTYSATLEDTATTSGLEVELHDVNFAYPTETKQDIWDPYAEVTSVDSPSQYALQNFNFKFEKGKLYSIVGQNGAGKTTLVQLLACLYHPTSGTITINGRNILDYDPNEIRANISVLFQDFSRFEFLSARETIEIGNLKDPEKQKKAELLATENGVTNFVSLDTILTDLSSSPKDPHETWRSDLSGGQWQKIGLARAFMRDDAGLLILDEPTSALDVEAEHEFFKQIRQRRRGKTTIFITHKFNTTKSADCILFIKHGRVWESGSHTELLKLDGEYARLYKLQTEGYNQMK